MFKDKLKELRQNKNISQATLADKIYVSRSAVAKWEQGRGLPTEDSLKLLCEYFNVSEDELLDKKEPLQICSELSKDNKKKTNIIKLLILVICIFIVGGLVFLFSTGVIEFNNDGIIEIDGIKYLKQEDTTLYDKDVPYQSDTYRVWEIIKDDSYVRIPKEIDGIPVYGITFNRASSPKYNVVGIDIGDVYELGGNNFNYWLNLKYIKMDNVKHLSTEEFSNCRSLEKLIIPKTVEDVFFTFNGCDSLKELYFLGNPEIQGSLGDKAEEITIYGFINSTAEEYAQNNGYKFVTIDNKILNEISEFQKYHEEKFADTNDDYVFIDGLTYSCPREYFSYDYIYIDGLQYQCISKLKERLPNDKCDGIIMPDEIDIILYEAFRNGHLYSSVHLNNVIEIFDGAFMHQWINEINLSKVEKIGSAAFYYCENLKTITIPQTVKYIGSNAFLGASLKEIYFESNPEKIEKLGLSKGVVIYGIPGGTVEEYAKTYGYKFVDITKNS